MLFPCLARIQDIDEQYLGTNLFTNLSLPSGTAWNSAAVRAPHLLLSQHNQMGPQNQPVPGFFIVAGRQRILGGVSLVPKNKNRTDIPTWAKLRPAPPPLVAGRSQFADFADANTSASAIADPQPHFASAPGRVIDDSKGPLGSRPDNIPRPKAYFDIAKNAASIVAIALIPAQVQSQVVSDRFKVLAYTGGDVIIYLVPFAPSPFPTSLVSCVEFADRLLLLPSSRLYGTWKAELLSGFPTAMA